MGIAELWPLLELGFGKRVSFSTFVDDFVRKCGRTPRIAIDAYAIIYLSSHQSFEAKEYTKSVVVRNIMAKLMHMVQLNVTFVVVFDGKFKPPKLRNGEKIVAGTSYEEKLSIFSETAFSEEAYLENGPGSELVKELTDLFKLYKIEFIQSPGEAEAQCAVLQMFNLVDYVLSNDVDALIFGSTKLLRNFSRNIDDTSARSPTHKKDYYVTPVSMSEIEAKTHLNRNRLILIAALRGGDYSNGIEKVGIIRAKKISLCDFENKDLKMPNFADMLVKCFVNEHPQSIFSMNSFLKDRNERRSMFSEFMATLNKQIKINSKSIFSRSTRFSKDILIDEYITLLYLFPIVCPLLFKFSPSSLSYGELSNSSEELRIPLWVQENVSMSSYLEENVPRFNNLYRIKEIGSLLISTKSDCEGNIVLEHKEFLVDDFKKSIPLKDPRYLDLGVEHLLIKILSGKIMLSNMSMSISAISEKFDGEMSLILVKCEVKVPNDPSQSHGEKKSSEFVTGRSNWSTWLPRSLVRLVSSRILITLGKEKSTTSPRRTSPTKGYHQKSTLDTMGCFKQGNGEGHTSMLDYIQLKNPRVSPNKRGRKSPKLPTMQPGQQLITNYFRRKDSLSDLNPFFLNEDNSFKSIDYSNLRGTLLNKPVMEYLKKREPVQDRPSFISSKNISENGTYAFNFRQRLKDEDYTAQTLLSSPKKRRKDT